MAKKTGKKKYRVFDVEANKERIISECFTPLEVGTERRVSIKNKKGILEAHTFRVLEELAE